MGYEVEKAFSTRKRSAYSKYPGSVEEAKMPHPTSCAAPTTAFFTALAASPSASPTSSTAFSTQWTTFSKPKIRAWSRASGSVLFESPLNKAKSASLRRGTPLSVRVLTLSCGMAY